MTYAEKYKEPLDYIESYWDKIIIKPEQFYRWKKLIITRGREKRFRNVLDVPNAFIVPNDHKFKHIFYWDSFFMLKGVLGTKRDWISKKMVGNFIYLFEKYGVIPNFNSPASSGRSQPPFLTSMILDAYKHPRIKFFQGTKLNKLVSSLVNNRNWLEEAAEVAKKEYFHVWDDKESLFNHKIEKLNLNRYGDLDMGYAHSSELESGWDFTSRFYNRCNEFLPIDLNTYLFKYEKDFAEIASHLGNALEAKAWKDRSTARRERVNKYMWNENEGFFFDYNYAYNRQSEFLSLAGFTPLWAGLASMRQARKMVKKLKKFETRSGLTITAKESLAPKIDISHVPLRYKIAVEDVLAPKQWDYPYIWPPLEYLTVIGLLKYGFIEDAKRIMKKALTAQSKIFKKHKTFFEKIKADTDDIPADFHYKNQSGFGWTNAIFYRYVSILESIEANKSIYEEPRGKNPPYRLSIPV